MNKGISIFANYNTNERIVVFLDPIKNDIHKIVNEKYSGNWVKVNEFCLGDEIKFKSDDIYQGFDDRIDDNYCKGSLIKK